MSTHLSRREFLQTCLASAAALVGTQRRPVRLAAAANSADILVVVFLRGGWDVLNVIPPRQGKDRGLYESARPDIAIPAKSLLPLDDRFGMHPALSPLYEHYQDRNLAIIHAVGLDYDTRSHFDAMTYIESGTPGEKNTQSGWLTRHLQTSPHASTGLLSSISTNGQPTALLSAFSNVTMSEPSELTFWDNGLKTAQEETLAQLYAGNDLAATVSKHTLDILKLMQPLNDQTYSPANGARYSDDDFGQRLKTVAQMIKLEAGLQVAAVDFDGWDTHQDENDGVDGYLSDQLSTLGNGLANFYLDLDDYASRLTVVVMSEFGRRLAQNESRGTDHGHGGAMLVLGGGVNGGQVYGTWPGLENANLYDRADLAITTDYRQVLSELLVNRLQNPAIERVFPGFTPQAEGLGIFQPR